LPHGGAQGKKVGVGEKLTTAVLIVEGVTFDQILERSPAYAEPAGGLRHAVIDAEGVIGSAILRRAPCRLIAIV
jgi:hypothetical protein